MHSGEVRAAAADPNSLCLTTIFFFSILMHFVWPSTCSETPTKSFPTVRISVCYMYLCRVACPLCVVFVSVPGCVCVSKRMATRFGPRMARITLHHDGHTHSGMARRSLARARGHIAIRTQQHRASQRRKTRRNETKFTISATHIYIYMFMWYVSTNDV